MASFLDTLFGGGAEKEAADKDRAALSQYQGQAIPALQQYYGQGTTALNQGISGYQPLAQLGQTYSAAAPTYMAALGVGTPDQVAAARTGFTQTPGYQALLDSAAQGVARQRAIGGMGASGNADIDAMLAAAGVTSQQYQQYVDNLQKAGTMGIGATNYAAAGQMGGYADLAKLAQSMGGDVSGVYGNVAQGNIGANNLQAAGEAAGAKNLLNFGMNVASMAAGGGGFGGGLGSLFGGSGLTSNLFGSSPSYGGGNVFSGDAWGGSSSQPLPGLTAQDYGFGY